MLGMMLSMKLGMKLGRMQKLSRRFSHHKVGSKGKRDRSKACALFARKT